MPLPQIPVVADLPVGENLQDHLFVGGVAATAKKSCEAKLNSASIIINYAFRKQGPLSIPAAVEAVAFMSTDYVNASLDYPDVEVVLLSVSPASEEGERYLLDTGLTKEVLSRCRPAPSKLPVNHVATFLKDHSISVVPAIKVGGFAVLSHNLFRTKADAAVSSVFGAHDNVVISRVKSEARKLCKKAYDKYYKSKRNQHGFQLAPILNRLKSRGHIRLRSSDPDEPPIIDPRYFTHPEDIKVAAQGTCFCCCCCELATRARFQSSLA
ncbi:hypothetical protein HPB48_010085 [Haemaphysalis longicornis]|uniref:Glucose-methanol-choline oxidoreductase C-terminal domain-containing protein n=1 Tax=Haemaphysalis longicornis TaxID=44386 RepID=A0A9J6GA02_HAELO|nr:hypothetical protein HPB48_010085 [Haemaphysalis longicornis]